MIMSLAELAAIYPFLRRYAEQGFELARPILSLEMEFEIESINQSLIVNRQTSDVRNAPAFAV